MVTEQTKEFTFIRDLAHYLFESDDLLTTNQFEDKVDMLKNLSNDDLYDMYNVKVINNKYIIEERFL